MKFHEKLSRLLEFRRKSQTDLARESGLHLNTVHRLRTGSQRPYLDQAFCLANVLDVPISYLADETLDEIPAFSNQPDSEDDRMILALYHALGLTRDQALRALATMARSTVSPEEPGRGV